MDWSDAQTVIATQRVLSGAMVSGVLDLRRAEGAHLFIAVGKGGSVQPSTAINIVVRPIFNAGTTAGVVGGAGIVASYEANAERTATIYSTVVSGTVAAGAKQFPCKARNAGLAAGNLVVITPGSSVRTEFARIHNTRVVATASQLAFDSPLMFKHSTTSDKVFNNAQTWATDLTGGSKYKVIIRHPGTAGSPQVVQVRAQVQFGAIES